MSMTVKAFLDRNGDSKAEIRRFTIPADVSTSYEYLKKKITEIFTGLTRSDVILRWQDPDNDMVVFSTDEELMAALSFKLDDVFRVFVKEGKKFGQKTQGEIHPGVVCDGCDAKVSGPRYKCCVCPDYDLCSECNMAGLHEEHEMFKIPKPKEMGPGGPWGAWGFGGPHQHGGPPPHFRRWMNKFMRRWHTRNESPCGAENTQADSANADANENEKAEEEYLKTMGENVAAMLDPFGIDVHVDVEHSGGRKHCRGPGDSKKCHGKGRKCDAERCSKKAKADTEQLAKDMADVEINDITTDGVDGEECCVKQKEKCGSPDDKEWTFLKDEEDKTSDKDSKSTEDEKKEEQMEQNANAPPHPPQSPHHMPYGGFMGPFGGFHGFVPPHPSFMSGPPHPMGPTPPHPMGPTPPGPPHMMHPHMPNHMGQHMAQHMTQHGNQGETPKDPKIAEALKLMLSMGFNNENGWLTHVLQENDGDINKILDMMKAGNFSAANRMA